MGSVRKKGAGYEARYRDPAGRSRSKSFKKAGEARAFLAKIETDKNSGTFVDPARGRVRFEKWSDDVMAAKLDQRPAGKDRDLSHLRTHILPAFGTAPLSQIQRAHVRDFVIFLSERKGLAPRTVRDIYNVLGYIMREAVDEKLIASSPCYRIPLPHIPETERRFLTHDQVIKLSRSIDPRYSALVLTGAYMGLRWEEAAGLKRQRLDVMRRKLHVAGTIERVGNGYRYVDDTKTKAARRMLDVPKPLAEILAKHLDTHSDTFVFPNPGGGFLHYSNWMSRSWKPAVRSAGLEPLTFHELRHTCVALLIEQGADILFVQRFLGHKDIRTTANVYGHMFPQRGERLSDAMGAALSAASIRRVGNLWDTTIENDPTAHTFGGANA